MLSRFKRSLVRIDCRLTLGRLQFSGDLVKAERVLPDQRIEASKLRKKVKTTLGYRESRTLVDFQRARLDNLQRMKAKANRISTRSVRCSLQGGRSCYKL